MVMSSIHVSPRTTSSFWLYNKTGQVHRWGKRYSYSHVLVIACFLQPGSFGLFRVKCRINNESHVLVMVNMARMTNAWCAIIWPVCRSCLSFVLPRSPEVWRQNSQRCKLFCVVFALTLSWRSPPSHSDSTYFRPPCMHTHTLHV